MAIQGKSHRLHRAGGGRGVPRGARVARRRPGESMAGGGVYSGFGAPGYFT